MGTVTRIDESIELFVDGMPQSVATPVQQAMATLTLLQTGIEGVGAATAGLLGGVRNATLRIGNELYTLTWSLKVLRPLVALEVSSLAIKYIEQKIEDGTFDEEMAIVAAAYIREEYTRTFGARRNRFSNKLRR